MIGVQVPTAEREALQVAVAARPWPKAPLLLAGVVAAVAAGVFWLVHDSMVDDAYITLTYARTLAFHGEWGMIPGMPANSATSPLNVLVLAALTVVLRSAVHAAGALFIVSAVVLALGLRRAAIETGMRSWVGLLGAAAVAFNPLLLSTVGLEMPMAAALLGLLLVSATGRRPLLFGVVAGLLVMTRVDLALFSLIILIGRPSLLRAWWKWLIPALAVTAPWYAFSWLHFGSLVPDTLLIKTWRSDWGGYYVATGFEFFHRLTPVPVSLVMAITVAGILCAVGLCLARAAGKGTAAWPWVLLGIGGVAHYCAYSLLKVPPYHWYYAPLVIGATIALAGAGGLLASRGWKAFVATVGAVLVASQVVFAVGWGTPWRGAPIMTNWGSTADYARIGRAVKEIVGDRVVASPGEIGLLAYFCDCTIVDQFSDRGFVSDALKDRIDQSGALGRTFFQLNYWHFEPVERRPVDFVMRRVMEPGDPFWTISSTTHPPSHLVIEPAPR